MSLVVERARRLAKSGLVLTVAGHPDFACLADDAVSMVPEDFEPYLLERSELFREALERIEKGIARLPINGSVRSSVDTIIDRIAKRKADGYRTVEWFGDCFHEWPVPDTFVDELPGAIGLYAKSASRAAKLKLTFIDAYSVAHWYDRLFNGVPVVDARIQSAWARLEEADRQGIAYWHRERRGYRQEDEPILTRRNREDMAAYRSNPKILVAPASVQKLEDIVKAIPGMRTRECIRDALASVPQGGTRTDRERKEYWSAVNKLAKTFAHFLYSRIDAQQYALVINGFGTGTWKGTDDRYFEPQENWSAELPAAAVPDRLQMCLQRGLTQNFRKLFQGYDFAFEKRDLTYELDAYVSGGKLTTERRAEIDTRSDELVRQANEAFFDFRP